MAAANEKVIELKYPVTITESVKSMKGAPFHAGQVVSSVVLRRIKARDLRFADTNAKGIDGTYKLLAAMNDLPIEVVEDIDAFDMTLIMEEFVPFLDDLPGAKQ